MTSHNKLKFVLLSAGIFSAILVGINYFQHDTTANQTRNNTVETTKQNKFKNISEPRTGGRISEKIVELQQEIDKEDKQKSEIESKLPVLYEKVELAKQEKYKAEQALSLSTQTIKVYDNLYWSAFKKIDISKNIKNEGVMVGVIMSLKDYLYQIEKDETILANIQKDISEKEAVVSNKKQQLILSEENYDNEKKKLQLSIKNKKELEELFAEISKNQNLIVQINLEMEDEIKDIKKIAFEETFNTNNLPPLPKAKFIMPVKGDITSPFGWREHPISGAKLFHNGIDIGADTGEEVVSTAYGIVSYSGWMSGYGKTIVINHGNNNYSLYGHNSSLLVNKGEYVQQGQVISLVGSTGYSTGPHLHFSIWVNDEITNPLEVL